MLQAIRERVTIKPGGLLQVRRPDLPSGVEADVIIMIEQPGHASECLASFVGKGKGCFKSVEDVDAFIRNERDSWSK